MKGFDMETSNCSLSFFSSAFLWIVLFLSRGSLAQPASDYLLSIHTELEFEAVSIPATGGGAAERVTKWLVPAKDDPKLLSSLFQNVARYPFHYEFLAAVFPDRFPGLTFEEYLDLVERRATRSYFAGVFFRLSGNPEKLYGFDVFTADADPSELPQVDEVRWAFQHLSAVFSF